MRSLFTLLFFCTFFHLAFSQQIDDSEIKMSIFFGGGSYYVDSKQEDALKVLIESIKKPELYEVYVHGHTDNIGSLEYNQWLSDMRTDEVITKIEKHGIPKEFIFEKDFGEQAPVYSNETYSGQLMNRRVDIIFKKLEM